MAMKYASFDAKDDKGINKFLQVTDKWIGSNGAYVFETRVHFMWNELTDDEAKRQAIVEEIKKRLINDETNIALQQVEVDHARDESKHSGKNANKVVEAETVLAGMKRKLDSTRKVMAQVLAGEYDL